MSEAFWTGLAAILTGVAGIIYAWAAVIKAKKEANEECDALTHSLRLEAETLAAELHQIKLSSYSKPNQTERP